MIFKEDPVKIGYVSKHHGVHGGMLVATEQVFSDEPEWPQWIFIEIEGGLVPYPCQQEDCFQKDDHSLVLFIKGSQKSELVTGLIDHSVYFPRKIIGSYNENQWNPSGLIGFQTQLKDYSELGEIIDWIDIPGNPLLVVKWKDQELLVPAHDDIIKSIDYDNKSLIILPPEGLISL